MSKRIIYLVRHGQYHIGKRDKGLLTERGLEQARTTGFALRNIPFERLIYSPVARAKQSAEIIGEMLQTYQRIEEPLLKECIPTVPEAYHTLFNELYPELTLDTMHTCSENFDKIITQYFIPVESTEIVTYDLMVCHGNVIRYLVSQILQPQSDFWVRMIINHCSITRIAIESEGQSFLVSHNDIGHLSDDLITEN